MDEVVTSSTSRQRFNMLLMTVFGGAALFLAAIGIYGLMAYSVQQRTQEIGIRLALGAGSRPCAQDGGLSGHAPRAGRSVDRHRRRVRPDSRLATFLFGVKERDLAVFIAVPVVLTVVSLIAVWLPARRAAKVDPVIALRTE